MYPNKLSEADTGKTKLGYRRTRHAKPCKDMRYVCQVCGDVAFGYNFNAITCESCKSFFRRQAQTPNLLLTCSNNDECKITKETRKHCPACRMKKCESVGMSKLRLPQPGADKHPGYDTNLEGSPSASIDTEQLSHMPLKERYKAARRILDDLETIVPSASLSKMHLQLTEVATFCGNQMIAPFSVPDVKTLPNEPQSLERTMYAQQIERRFVNSLKACPDFANLSEQQQLDVLKHSMLNYHNLVSAFYVDVDEETSSTGWRIPLLDREPLWISKDVIYGHFEKAGTNSEIQNFFEAYLNLAKSIRRRFGSHWTSVQFILTLIQLFSPFSLDIPGALALHPESSHSAHDNYSTLAICLPLHYKYTNFLQAYCEWLDGTSQQTRQWKESSWSFCMDKLVEIHNVNRKFVQAVKLLAPDRDSAN